MCKFEHFSKQKPYLEFYLCDSLLEEHTLVIIWGLNFLAVMISLIYFDDARGLGSFNARKNYIGAVFISLDLTNLICEVKNL